MKKVKGPLVNVIILTFVVLFAGIVITVISELYEEKNIYTDVGHSIGITLISAGTIGVIVEIFAMWFITSKMLKLEESFLAKVIPRIINTSHEWVTKSGKSIPIDKDALYQLIGIGYTQWFMKESFSKVGILSSKVSELYQNVQLKEFKEPLIIDFATTLKYNGHIEEKLVGRNDLINLFTKTEFKTFNS